MSGAGEHKLKWRRSHGYHYYEGNGGGYGYVHPAAGGGYLASGMEESSVTKTIAAGKRFVEKVVRQQLRKGRRHK